MSNAKENCHNSITRERRHEQSHCHEECRLLFPWMCPLSPQLLDLEDLEEVRANAMQRAMASAKKALSKGLAAANECEAAAAALNHGAKLVHAWPGRIGTKPQLAEEVVNGSEHFCTPVDMMASRFKTWVAKWQKTRDSTQDTVMAVQEIRKCAKANQDLPKIVLKDLDDERGNRVAMQTVLVPSSSSL